MNTCPNCGSVINENQRFCTVCGTKIEQTEPENIALNQMEVTPVVTPNQPMTPESPVIPEQPITPEQPVIPEPVVIPNQPVTPEPSVRPEPTVIPEQPILPKQPATVAVVTKQIDESELIAVSGNAWTNFFKVIAWFLFILEIIGIIGACVIQITYKRYIPINNIWLILAAVGALFAAFLMFAGCMLFLSVASDITKTRKHLYNIEYILKNK